MTPRVDVRMLFRWMAPETLLHRRYSPASDVWSLGVLFWEVRARWNWLGCQEDRSGDMRCKWLAILLTCLLTKTIADTKHFIGLVSDDGGWRNALPRRNIAADHGTVD